MSVIREYLLSHADVRVEEDLVSVRLHGGMTQEQIPHSRALLHELHEQPGGLFLLLDLKEAERASPSLRRAMSQIFSEVAPTAMAVYGANLEQRAAHELLMGAVAGLSGRRPNVAYFPSEAEAREWLVSERRRMKSPA
ncbi:MAG: hypothetical protein U1A78_28820 [Polyangia bacterium]